MKITNMTKDQLDRRYQEAIDSGTREAIMEAHRIYGTNPNRDSTDKDKKSVEDGIAAMELQQRFELAMEVVPLDIISLIKAYGDSRVMAPTLINSAFSRLVVGVYDLMQEKNSLANVE